MGNLCIVMRIPSKRSLEFAFLYHSELEESKRLFFSSFFCSIVKLSSFSSFSSQKYLPIIKKISTVGYAVSFSTLVVAFLILATIKYVFGSIPKFENTITHSSLGIPIKSQRWCDHCQQINDSLTHWVNLTRIYMTHWTFEFKNSHKIRTILWSLPSN